MDFGCEDNTALVSGGSVDGVEGSTARGDGRTQELSTVQRCNDE